MVPRKIERHLERILFFRRHIRLRARFLAALGLEVAAERTRNDHSPTCGSASPSTSVRAFISAGTSWRRSDQNHPRSDFRLGNFPARYWQQFGLVFSNVSELALKGMG
jgi:hypothetical protein